MTKKYLFFTIFFCLLIYGFISDKDLNSIIEDGAQLEKLSDGFLFTEGPAADTDGNVFFTDQPNDRIMVWRVNGKLETFLQPSGRSNGLYFDNKGNLWACADEKNELWMISPEKVISKYPYKYNDKPLNGPNDLWIAGNGGIYITDPFYKRDYWDHTEKEIDPERVYYLTPDGKDLQIVVDDFVKPNGLVGTHDGKKLYITDIGAGKTYSYTIETNGHLANKTLFTEMGSDGLTLDNKDNVYLTGKGVTVFDKNGKQIEHIDVPENWTANVTFGGKNQKTLFITAGKSVYTIKMKVKGIR